MDTRKHTPGPWKWDGSFPIEITAPPDPDDELRGRLHVCSGMSPAQQEDARLIAAAPDLLAALKLADEHLTMLYPQAVKSGDFLCVTIRSVLEKASTL